MMSEDDNHHFGAVDETTKRLVGRCGRVSWLKNAEPLSPTWVQQRFLGVNLPSAMESSLSVVEVTTQREIPGVKTPSRGEVDKASENNINSGNDPGTGGNGAVTARNDRFTKAIGEEKSPFEVEGEA